MSHNTSSIGDLIKAFFKERGLEEKFEEIDLTKQWEDIVGPMIAKHTVGVNLRNKKLILKLNSAALRHTLSFSKTELIEKLNNKLGEGKISEVELK